MVIQWHGALTSEASRLVFNLLASMMDGQLHPTIGGQLHPMIGGQLYKLIF